MARESGRVKKIVDWLNTVPKTKAVKRHGSVFSQHGEPDIYCCHRGRFFALECKNDEGKARPTQIVRLRQWRDAGATVGLVRNVEDAARIVVQGIRQDESEWLS